MKLLPQDWYFRDVQAVARDLVGRHLKRGDVILRVTEVEAYCGPSDTAAHTRMGHTPRNAPMWGEGGHAYVYLCYGIHNMLNVVTGRGDGTAVLIRSAETVAGLATICRRRSGKTGPALLTGPGKVGQALDLSTDWSGHALFRTGGLQLLEGTPARRLIAGPRVGIDYAEPDDIRAHLRFADADSESMTHRRQFKH
ncbi:MAG: DNA-3-methyladenine glycosylase [Planctomycetes bacterium]|nr:DNA-3-methyladenine glycosylase [Planctomycetota bacterium]